MVPEVYRQNETSDDSCGIEGGVRILERIGFQVRAQGEISEDARIRNAQEKQAFFDGKSKELRAQEIVRVERPNACLCEENIPNDEKSSHGQVDGKEVFPLFVEGNLFVETEDQWQR